MHRLPRLAMPFAVAAALALTIAPAGAAVELGGGTVNAGIGYNPTLGVTCAATTLDVEGGVPENPTVVVGTGTAPYVGWFSFNGSGTSTCESLAGGGGTLAIWGDGGMVGGGDFRCGSLNGPGPLTGTYLREGGVFTATVSGSCTVDFASTIQVTATITGAWVWELNHGSLYGTIVFTEA